MNVDITGYKDLTEVLRTEAFALYRGRREGDQFPVLIKSPLNAYPSPEEIAQVRHEYQMMQAVNGRGALRVLGLENVGNRLMIVSEDFSGLSLRNQLVFCPVTPIALFLDIAVALAHGLGEIHRSQVIHKGLNPSHILWDAQASAIQLIDFRLATALLVEKKTGRNVSTLEGELQYMSPEQTGRMNRPLDYRTDFYSLGVIFFELLTGQLPYRAEDAMGWVYCHIVKPAPSPGAFNPNVPIAVSELVLKLLSKEVEDRYQSAESLILDLQTCQKQWKEAGAVPTFALGQWDVSEKFTLSQKLYGREQEIQSLLGAFERVTSGPSELILVSGAPGVGKSALVNEVQRSIVRKRGFFIEGKFDQFQKNIPYHALSQAFRGLMQQVLSESSDRLAAWKSKFHAALGPNAQIIMDIVPELVHILGKASAPSDANPTEARNRLFITFRNFVNVFAQPEHPLVLFLDDLQWSDSPTLALLESLITADELTCFLVIGAYRDNEVMQGHSLSLSLDEIEKKRPIQRLYLAPLSQQTVNQLLADTLRCSSKTTEELAQIIFDKTKGSPFFVNALFTKLYQEGCVRFSHEQGKWQWELSEVRSIPVSENVVEFLIKELQMLEGETLRMLQMASCIGNKFTLKTLSEIAEQSVGKTAETLWPAVLKGMLIPLDGHYLMAHTQTSNEAQETFDFGVQYAFQHDRVQQAAYALISERKRQEYHFQIGRLLHKNDPSEERIIEIVSQLNAGRKQIEMAHERLELAQLNLSAGKKAKASSAYLPALQYLTVGLELLPQQSWSTHYDLCFALHREYTECAYLSGQFDEAENNGQILLSKARTDLERAEIHRMQALQYTVIGKLEKAIQSGLQGLALLGESLSAKPGLASVIREVLVARWRLGRRSISSLIDLPVLHEPQIRLSMKILMELGPPAYLMGNDNLMAVAAIKQVNLSLKHGNCPESAYAYVFYAMILGGILGDLEGAYAFGQLGVALNERLDDRELRCRLLFMYAMFTHHWNQPWESLAPFFRRSIEAGYQSGDLFYMAYSSVYLPISESQSDLDKAIVLGAKYLRIIQATQYENAWDMAILWQQMRLNLCGRTRGPLSLSDENYDEDRHFQKMRQTSFFTGLAIRNILLMELGYHYEDFSFALAQIREIETGKLLKAVIASTWIIEYQLYLFLTLTATYPQSAPPQKRWARRRMNQAMKIMRRWSAHAPGNSGHHRLLMQAELARVSSRPALAQSRYDQAIESARASGYVRYEALACELAAKFFLGQNQKKLAAIYLRDAHYLYTRWGASAKVKQLEQRYAALLSQQVTHLSLNPIETPNQDVGKRDLDLMTVTKASQMISVEIVLPELLKKLLLIVRENAGAEKCLLILLDESTGRWVLEGESRGEEPIRVQQSEPIEQSSALSLGIVQFVIRSSESVVLDNATASGPFTQDPYILKQRPKSVLCMPILKQGQLIGALYLENNIATHAFTPERLQVLSILASQAAISITNAGFYSHVTRLNQAYGCFVPHEFLRLLEKRSILDVKLGDQRQTQMTVLFSDIRSFTTLSEGMSPQQNFNFLNSYLGVMEPLIMQHKGYIDKYIGDGVMALFPNQTDDALGAGIAMLQRLIEYNEGRNRTGFQPIQIGIGINTGDLILGIIGGQTHMEGTVISDAVNVASRIESLTKEYGTPLLISEFTLAALHDPSRYHFRLIDRVRANGKTKHVTIYEVLNADSPETRQGKLASLKQFEQARSALENSDRAQAQALFEECLRICPSDKAASAFLARSRGD